MKTGFFKINIKRRRKKVSKLVTKFNRVGIYNKGIYVRVLLRQRWRVYFKRALNFIHRCLFQRRLLAWGAIYKVLCLAWGKKEYSTITYLTIYISWWTFVWYDAYALGSPIVHNAYPIRIIPDFFNFLFGIT